MYQTLTQDEQDDIIVEFMVAQERDKFCHEINLARYTAMLQELPTGKWRDQVTKLRDETVSRLAEVNSIIKASQNQMLPIDRILAAITRIKAKRI